MRKTVKSVHARKVYAREGAPIEQVMARYLAARLGMR